MTPLDKLKASPAGLARIAAADTGLAWDYPPHLRALNRALLDVARGATRFLLVFMPPGHAKSSIISEAFPAWLLGTQPHAQIILSTYGQEFSETWGRKARDLLLAYGPALYGVGVRQDSKSVSEWRVAGKRGVMYSVGVGGQTTGKRADYALIDDPVKNAEEAESEVYREMLYRWFQQTLYTRLTPAGAVVLCMCMTGDTPVLRPDGTTTPLRDVRPGDAVATYENGRLSSSTVVNWANQGPDFIYAIRMQSGVVVRANARHPFLTVDANGVESWERTDTLRPGSRILRATGANGVGSSVRRRGATSQQNAKDYAIATTVRHNGQQDTAHLLPSTRNTGVPSASSSAMGSPLRSTNAFSRHRTGDAPFASGPQRSEILDPTGTENFALTMTTTPVRCAACSAMTATSPSDTEEPQSASVLPLHTWSVTPDTVVEVTPAGIEDVFDVQVDRTENFIANGLVSHNTRWHHDDVAGRLLADRDAGRGLPWRVLNFPALAEEGDELGRAVGEPLWPRLYGAERLAEIQATLSELQWLAMYQQRPTPASGSVYQRDWFEHRYDAANPPKIERTILTVDSAFKTGVGSDFSALEIWGVGATGYYLLHVMNERLEYPDLIAAIRQLAEQHRVAGVYIEDKASGQSAVQTLQRETRLPVVPVPVTMSKQARADGNTPTWRAGRVFLPQHAPWVGAFVQQHVTFPRAAHDDMVDAGNIALDVLKYGGVSYGRVTY